MGTEQLVSRSATETRNGYHLVGDGHRKVMVLHGWLSDAGSWSAVWQTVDRHAFTWCFMDARGYGLSRARRGAYTMAEIAQDALAVADSLGWREFSLVGHSMTGLAIQRTLLAAPDRIRALVGVTPVPASGGGLVGERRVLFDRAVRDVEARAAIIDRSTGSKRGELWARSLAERSFACSETDAVRGYLDSWADGDFHTEILGNPVPVGVIVGAYDPSLTERRMAETWLSWYPNSCLNVLNSSGHYPMDEQPCTLTHSIDKMLVNHVANVGG
ncbi:alpha/beta fold hydrolase [Streptomyces malaysiensis]|uniref:alpha/beta fold hydrolase n=1 Tax=Streptomyces malaysiensis TaxID=92644 RepID=UPI002B2CFB3B|nr:alpha/beta hydrolase [Streptomyces malaysiensis]